MQPPASSGLTSLTRVPMIAASSSSWSSLSVYDGHGISSSGPITVSGMPR